MCTAAAYRTRDFYFGRTLDYESSHGEDVTVTPRRYPFPFRTGETMERHHAIIGMAYVAGGYPLYCDAVNEKGLGMAGPNLVGDAVFHEPDPEREDIAAFEFIPWVLCRCATVSETREELERADLTNETYSPLLPIARLHWIIADKSGAIVVESMKDGLHVHDDPTGVPTNDPPFAQQMFDLNDHMVLPPAMPSAWGRSR